MADWSIKDLEEWNEKIEALVKEMGLDCYPQEFEICDYHDMLGYQSYSGMPSRYPHWSFGKSFEKQKMVYQHGMGGLAYEIVINTNPCLAYLMIDNPLSMQILTMAHVFGHNDFFKNNIHFSQTRADLALEMFKRHANRVRSYIEDPGIGYEKVERILDAAHAISFQCDRNAFLRALTESDFRKRSDNKAQEDKWEHLTYKNGHQNVEVKPDLEYDLILFIRDNQPFLSEWEKDLLTIVRDETQYFLPQMETKIMNEGWASFWHYTILNRLNLPPNIHMDFIRSHNQVIRPHVGGLNPYHIGYCLFNKLAGSDGHQIEYEINKQIFDVRRIDRDSSFLRRFLTQELAQELHLFEYSTQGNTTYISEIADKHGWEKVRESLISNIGLNSIPIIQVKEISSKNELILKHNYDNRELELKYLEKTLEHVNTLWANTVIIETVIDNQPTRFKYKNGKFSRMADKPENKL
ncbi:MAG TPA: SpoVR family protein [Cytophagaceae bacterium]